MEAFDKKNCIPHKNIKVIRLKSVIFFLLNCIIVDAASVRLKSQKAL